MKIEKIIVIAILSAISTFAEASPFHSESSGTFAILTDPNLPIFQVGIEHPTVSATPYAFELLQAEQTVNLITPPPIAGAFTLTHLSGDTLTGSYVTDLVFLGPTEATADGTFIFTGGTGVFADASGGGTISAAIHLGSSTSEIVLDGALDVPDAGGSLLLASLGLLSLGVMRGSLPRKAAIGV